MALVNIVLFAMLISSSLAFPRDISHNLINSHIKTLQDNRQLLKLLKDIIEDMDNRIEVVQKRSVCYIGGGMSHNCEYGEALDSASTARHLLTGDTPGKRSRLMPTAF